MACFVAWQKQCVNHHEFDDPDSCPNNIFEELWNYDLRHEIWKPLDLRGHSLTRFSYESLKNLFPEK